MSDSIVKKDILFIISSNGTKTDVSKYMNLSQENVIWDYNQEFEKMILNKSSEIILLDKEMNITERISAQSNIQEQPFNY